jgi:hypothetical protein
MLRFSAQCLKKKNSIALRLINDTSVNSNVGSLSQHESLYTEQVKLVEVLKAQDDSQPSEQTELVEVTQSEQEVHEIKKTRKPRRHNDSE